MSKSKKVTVEVVAKPKVASKIVKTNTKQKLAMKLGLVRAKRTNTTV